MRTLSPVNKGQYHVCHFNNKVMHYGSLKFHLRHSIIKKPTCPKSTSYQLYISLDLHSTALTKQKFKYIASSSCSCSIALLNLAQTKKIRHIV